MAYSIPAYYSNADSARYINPYYVGQRPAGAGYERFDPNQVGAGIKNLPNPATAFDNIVASKFYSPVAIAPGVDSMRLGYAQSGGGFGGILQSEMLLRNPLNDNETAARAYNQELDLNQQRYRNYFESNPKAYDELARRGIDLRNIKSVADLDAIPYQLKGDVFGGYVDDFERAKQFENQKDKSGILDSLPGKIIAGGLLAAGTAGVGTALGFGAVGTGALVGGVQSAARGGGLKDIALGAGIGGLTGYAAGKFLPPVKNYLSNKLGFGSSGAGFTNPGGLGLSPKHLYNRLHLNHFAFDPSFFGGAPTASNGLGLTPANMFPGTSTALASLGQPSAWGGSYSNPGGVFTNPSALGGSPNPLYEPTSLAPSLPGSGGSSGSGALIRAAGTIAGNALSGDAGGGAGGGGPAPGGIGALAALPFLAGGSGSGSGNFSAPFAFGAGGFPGGQGGENGALRSQLGAGKMQPRPGRVPGYQDQPFANYLLV